MKKLLLIIPALIFSLPFMAHADILGTSTIGSADCWSAGYVIASSFTMGAASGTANSLSVYVSTAGVPYGLGIFSDSAGSPGALIVQSATSTSASGWNTIGIPGTVLTASSTYWLSVNNGGGGNCGSFTAAATPEYYKPSMPYDAAWPNPYGTPGGSLGNQVDAIYATYTPSGGGGGGSSTISGIAPINNLSSTTAVSGNVTNEMVSLSLYVLKNYQTPLVGIAIILALVGAIFGTLRILGQL